MLSLFMEIHSKKEACISLKALAAIDLLESWLEADEEEDKEQEESLKLLKKAINCSAASGRSTKLEYSFKVRSKLRGIKPTVWD